MKNQNIVISTQTILLTLLIAGLVWVLWLIKSVLLTLFISLILALALEPFVEWLKSKGIHHGLSVLIVVFTLIASLAGITSIAIAPFINQIRFLGENLPQYLNAIISLPGLEQYAQQFNIAFSKSIDDAAGNFLTATIGAFSGVVSSVVVLVFTTYILIDFNGIRDVFVGLFIGEKQVEVKSLLVKIENKLGAWLRGQIVLMFIIGLVTYVGLLILGVDYALALAVIAGLLEIVPIVGPIVSSVPALIIGFVISPFTGLGVLGLYVLIQQLENNLIVPKVMQKAVGFNPLVTILVLLVGAKLLGVIGAILAVPVAIIISEVYKYLLTPD